MAINTLVDHYFVNSPIIKRRLWKYYKHTSNVLYPPVELDQYYNEGTQFEGNVPGPKTLCVNCIFYVENTTSRDV